MNRIWYFDNIKFVLILLVVTGHFAETIMDTSQLAFSLRTFIYSFHMPAFIMISGMFYSEKREKNIRNVIFYFTVFLLMQSVSIIKGICLGTMESFDVFVVSGVPWYLLALCIWSIITSFLPRNMISRKYVIILAFTLGLIIGYDNSLPTDVFCISRVIVFYPFFLLGTIIDKNRLVSFSQRKDVKIASICIITIVAILCLFYTDYISPINPLLSARHQYYETGLYYWGACLRAALYIVELLMTFSVISLVPRRNLLISKLGTRTISVYALHYHFIILVSQLFPDRLLIFVPAAIIVTFILSIKYVYYPFEWIRRVCLAVNINA